MVEQRSSTPYVWVRSPLSLKILHLKKPNNPLLLITTDKKLAQPIPFCLKPQNSINNKSKKNQIVTFFNIKQNLNYLNHKKLTIQKKNKRTYNQYVIWNRTTKNQETRVLGGTKTIPNNYVYNAQFNKNDLILTTHHNKIKFLLTKIKIKNTTAVVSDRRKKSFLITFNNLKVVGSAPKQNINTYLLQTLVSETAIKNISTTNLNNFNNLYYPLLTTSILKMLKNFTHPQHNYTFNKAYCKHAMFTTNLSTKNTFNMNSQVLKTPSIKTHYPILSIKPMNKLNNTLYNLSLWLHTYKKRSKNVNNSLTKLTKTNYFSQYNNIFLTNSSSSNNTNNFYSKPTNDNLSNIIKTYNSNKNLYLKQLTVINSIMFISTTNKTPKLLTKSKNNILTVNNNNHVDSLFYENYHNIKYFYKNKPVYNYLTCIRNIQNQNPFSKKSKPLKSITNTLNLKRLLYGSYIAMSKVKTIYKRLNTQPSIKKNSLYFKYKYLNQKPLLLKKLKKRTFSTSKVVQKKLLWEKVPKINTHKLLIPEPTTNKNHYTNKHIISLFNKTLDTKIFYLTNRFSSFFRDTTPKYLKTLLKNITSSGGLNYLKHKTNNRNFLVNNILNKQKYLDTTNFTQSQNLHTVYKINTHVLSNRVLTNHPTTNITVLQNPFMLKLSMLKNTNKNQFIFNLPSYSNILNRIKVHHQQLSNISPSKYFSYIFFKKVYSSLSYNKTNTNFIPIYHTTLIRFMEHVSGNKVIIQFYPFVNQSITQDFVVKYKLWLPRLTFYEKRLGHKFFLEESLHILHLSFFLKDPCLLLKWLKAIILRISFWRTRSIFRFIKYLMLNFFQQSFASLGVKGFKVRLKGKISAAGNSRKRSILYRVGQTSHSTLNLKVAAEVDTIITFTGVMGLSVSIFY